MKDRREVEVCTGASLREKAEAERSRILMSDCCTIVKNRSKSLEFQNLVLKSSLTRMESQGWSL
eukprot:NODE_7673_length_554_cov_4.908911_g6642_i1.p3 GENE.NODE_7673_length_554_cov_4.908911_g6642_i1~~NODE_7673_length_554_cov_4.908911_g6642_i1.p3  ORF type:complete len:64 (-),score=6.48 NODE_7673_length_554_cov_4.908911_g6642_i1:189-380(-)